MKYSCNLIRDLIPLYCDEICSEESREAVEAHMEECEECQRFYHEMKQETLIQESIRNSSYEDQQIASMKKIRKKWKKKNFAFGIIGIIIGSVIVGVSVKLLILSGAIGILALDSALSKVEVYEDIKEYENYIGLDADKKYRDKWGMEDYDIFPETISDDMEVKDFKFIYYNPWDAQYLSYLTVEYDTEEAYSNEIERLRGEKQEKYVGYYSVTGEPEGYELLAMDSDSYQGFVYAITPKKDGEEKNLTITYVEIIFCNYFLDLDIHKYVPEKYLLEGFDATEDNPYENKMMEKN